MQLPVCGSSAIATMSPATGESFGGDVSWLSPLPVTTFL
jgi:hypothetical protein